jgi:hypothetical protein
MPKKKKKVKVEDSKESSEVFYRNDTMIHGDLANMKFNLN